MEFITIVLVIILVIVLFDKKNKKSVDKVTKSTCEIACQTDAEVVEEEQSNTAVADAAEPAACEVSSQTETDEDKSTNSCHHPSIIKSSCGSPTKKHVSFNMMGPNRIALKSFLSNDSGIDEDISVSDSIDDDDFTEAVVRTNLFKTEATLLPGENIDGVYKKSAIPINIDSVDYELAKKNSTMYRPRYHKCPGTGCFLTPMCPGNHLCVGERCTQYDSCIGYTKFACGCFGPCVCHGDLKF